MELLSERIRQDGITIDYTQRDRPPEGEQNPGADMHWWDVTLTLDEREISVPWGMGPAAGDGPELDDVMSMVTMGVRAVVNNGGYEEWCDEWGWSPDTEGRYETYEQWLRISGQLLIFLGWDRYSAYLHDTEDDV
jgi:hypothetical protein